MKKNVVFKVLDMHCTSCAMNIDMGLEDTEGIISSNTNYAKQQTKVEFYSWGEALNRKDWIFCWLQWMDLV